MAYDKVVDSSVLDAGLKTIADAIRAKGGTSDNLAFPTAMAEAIAAIESGGGGALWNGGKFTMGSFVLTEETTSEYVIATSSDDAMLGLLNDGESLSGVYSSIGLLVVIRPKGAAPTSTEKAKVFTAGVWFPTYFGSGAGYVRAYQYWDTYGSDRSDINGGLDVSYNKMSVKFTSSAKGSPNFEYLWLAWRGVV